jgi:hypothetical protein
MKKGCELFTSWGWKRGDPTLNWKPVECPAALKELIHAAFGPDGPKTTIAAKNGSQEIAHSAVKLAYPPAESTTNVSSEAMVVI